MSENQPEAAQRAQRNRSNAMITLGVVLFVMLALAMAARGDGGETPTGGIILGVLGAGLIVGGLVIRR